MKTIVDVGAEYQALRKKSGKTQREIANLIGTHQELISRFERGRGCDFSLGRLLQLVHAVGYDVQFIPLEGRPTLVDVLEERLQSKNTGSDSR
jgi:transcriptional regulator with XRE-family HTH domain